MYFLFLFTIAAGAVYFIFAPRRFDFLTVFFFSAVLYMIPAIEGHVDSFGSYYMEYTPQAYVIIVTFFIVIIIGAILRDMIGHPHEARPLHLEDSSASDYFAVIAAGGVLLGAGCLAMFIADDPRLALVGAIDYDAKQVMLENMASRPYAYGEMFITHAVIAAYLSKRRSLLAAAAGLALLTVYIGFRFVPVMSLLGIFVAASARSVEVKALYRRWGFCLACAVAAVAGNFIKPFMPAIKALEYHRVVAVFEHIQFSNTNFLLQNVDAHGPATIFLAGLDAGVELGYGHFISQLPNLLFFVGEAGVDGPSYNGYVQDAVLGVPRESIGLADSNLGSWYAIGGLGAIVIFSCGYTGLVIYLSSLMHRARRSYSLYLAWLPVLTFYNFRNDFSMMFIFSRQMVVTWFVLAAFAEIALASRSFGRLRPGGAD